MGDEPTTCRLCAAPAARGGLCHADYQWVWRHKRDPTEAEQANRAYRRWGKNGGPTTAPAGPPADDDESPAGGWGHLAKYGLTIDAYRSLLKQQDGRCAICGGENVIRKSGKLRKLFVDHNHSTGEVRGLLCHRCNVGIAPVERGGQEWADRALRYLGGKLERPVGPIKGYSTFVTCSRCGDLPATKRGLCSACYKWRWERGQDRPDHLISAARVRRGRTQIEAADNRLEGYLAQDDHWVSGGCEICGVAVGEGRSRLCWPCYQWSWRKGREPTEAELATRTYQRWLRRQGT